MRLGAGSNVPPVDGEALRYIPFGFALRHDVLAYAIEGGELFVAVADDEPATIDRVRLLTGMRVVATRFAREAIASAIASAYDDPANPQGRDENAAAPAVRIVDELHASAASGRASDIHVEPSSTGGRIRQRVDGSLGPVRALDKNLYSQVVARIKVLAELDVADRRQPQDGRYTFDAGGRSIDARVSSISTIDGERLVIRIFDSARQRPRLDTLGMDSGVLHRCRTLIGAPSGFVVVCGPTGSGKTTTLYAALCDRASDREHLCAIEDPIEMRLDGIAQIQVNVRAGLTFASALRAVLRQDPDVVMIGEIRDAETAAVGVAAALSGQLVLATMHSFDAVRAIERLTDLGIPRHALAASLSGVLAQRLVRTLCECVGASECARCRGSGFSGRTGIFECVVVDEALREAIAAGASSAELRHIAEGDGGATLARDAFRHVMSGRTTAAEVARVIGE